MSDGRSEIPLVRISDVGNSIKKETIVEEVAIRLYALKEDGTSEVHSTLLATPTDLAELHAGHLFSEDYVNEIPPRELFEIKLEADVSVHYNGKISLLPRERIVTSSCGACNHPDLAIHRDRLPKEGSRFSNLDLTMLTQALNRLTSSMFLFQRSGGCHGTALLSNDGSIAHVSEDIGRHNSVDKTIGKAIFSESTTLGDSMLLLSGRCGWDIVAKCVRTGIPAIASLGAFSSAAVDLAREHNVTLYGFVSDRGAWKVGY